jgi:hypothetical protein
VIFPKLTRSLIANAKGKEVEIVWPEGEEPPEQGHTYTVQKSRTRKGSYSILVKDVAEGADERWRATVVVAEEQRPLRIKAKVAADPQPMGGPQFRAELEPEQVPKDYQARLTAEGRRKTLTHQVDQRERRSDSRAGRRQKRSQDRRLAA